MSGKASCQAEKGEATAYKLGLADDQSDRNMPTVKWFVRKFVHPGIPPLQTCFPFLSHGASKTHGSGDLVPSNNWWLQTNWSWKILVILYKAHKHCLNPSHRSCCYSRQLCWCWRPKLNSFVLPSASSVPETRQPGDDCEHSPNYQTPKGQTKSKQPQPVHLIILWHILIIIVSPELHFAAAHWSSWRCEEVHHVQSTQTPQNHCQSTWSQDAGCGKGTRSSHVPKPPSLAFIATKRPLDAVFYVNCKMLAVV